MAYFEVKLLEKAACDQIDGDFAQSAGKIFFNALAALIVSWFLQFQWLVLMI